MSEAVFPTVVQGHTFTISKRYNLESARILGRGSYGVVTTAVDTKHNFNIAIKRIRPYANDEWDARHTLREVRLLKLLGNHPNIITLYGLSLYEEKTELYMFMELMDCDLHHVIQSKQPLSEMHYKCFARQMCEAIKAMHSIGVFHRDLKPGNILVNKECKLRITDFGLARFMCETTLSGKNPLNPMTEYVVTRWYRCPELLLAPNKPYSEAIDLWSIGCILAELIRRKPLFPGKSHANQVQLIFEVLGFDSVNELGYEISAEAASFLKKRCKFQKQPLESVIQSASPQAIELIKALLSIDPKGRPTAEEALKFKFMLDAETLCDYNVNYLTKPPDDLFDFEKEKYSIEGLKQAIHDEVLDYIKGGRSMSAGSASPMSLTSSAKPTTAEDERSTNSGHKKRPSSGDNSSFASEAEERETAIGSAAKTPNKQNILSSSSSAAMSTDSRMTRSQANGNEIANSASSAVSMARSLTRAASAGSGNDGSEVEAFPSSANANYKETVKAISREIMDEKLAGNGNLSNTNSVSSSGTEEFISAMSNSKLISSSSFDSNEHNIDLVKSTDGSNAMPKKKSNTNSSPRLSSNGILGMTAPSIQQSGAPRKSFIDGILRPHQQIHTVDSTTKVVEGTNLDSARKSSGDSSAMAMVSDGGVSTYSKAYSLDLLRNNRFNSLISSAKSKTAAILANKRPKPGNFSAPLHITQSNFVSRDALESATSNSSDASEDNSEDDSTSLDFVATTPPIGEGSLQLFRSNSASIKRSSAASTQVGVVNQGLAAEMNKIRNVASAPTATRKGNNANNSKNI